jgi:hypothetical protein
MAPGRVHTRVEEMSNVNEQSNDWKQVLSK